MSTIKSFSVGVGDCFYVYHNSPNFSIIDCYFPDGDTKKRIIKEIKYLQSLKEIPRFISTHPDQDHISGLKDLNDEVGIVNFYCVKNSVKKDDPTNDFKHYCSLRDSKKTFFLEKGCSRKWLNESSDERGGSGIYILWPDVNNEHFKGALKDAEEDGNPNNISPIIQYKLKNGVNVLWFGDLESDFMEEIEDEIKLPEADIIFAPHHGRESGKIPDSWLKSINPKIIIIGEAPSDELDYYDGYNTITQNSAGDITLECVTGKVHIFTSKDYDVDFLDDEYDDIVDEYSENDFYLGTLTL